jgi:sugar phosphate isomerase/epimerase
LKELFDAHGLRPATWGLAVRGAQTEWDVDLGELREFAAIGDAIGAARCITWVPSWHDARAFDENRTFHVGKFREVCEALDSAGCVFGMEFLGPKTLQSGHRFGFIRRMEDMLALADEIGTGNVGLLVDAYHLYTSGGTLADLEKVPLKSIVHVHINDALAGVPVDELPDGQRALPLETGVIDLGGFLKVLKKKGYAGPVVTEPFSARINAVAASDPLAAAREVAVVMGKVWELARLGL